MKLTHHCSKDALIEILNSGKYVPAYKSPAAGDSGINCFIDGREYNKAQYTPGVGAEIHLKWEGPIREVPTDEPFPLKPNILHNQGRWRAIIPAGTDKKNIKVCSIKVQKPKGIYQALKIWSIKRKLKTGPIYLEIINS